MIHRFQQDRLVVNHHYANDEVWIGDLVNDLHLANKCHCWLPEPYDAVELVMLLHYTAIYHLTKHINWFASNKPEHCLALVTLPKSSSQ